MTIVIDASVVLASIINEPPNGSWASNVMRSDDLIAPHHLLVEVASALARAVRRGSVDERIATLAHAEVLNLQVRLQPYRPYSQRVWELRQNVSAYDAWYIALAEMTGSLLATLDLRLTRAPGPRCGFLTPDL